VHVPGCDDAAASGGPGGELLELFVGRRFAVERSAFAIVHPRVIGAALRGLVVAPSNPFAGGAEQGGLPADFFLDSSGTIQAVRYGQHADDQWSVEDVLALAAKWTGKSAPVPTR
jgi:hypothetical protein